MSERYCYKCHKKENIEEHHLYPRKYATGSINADAYGRTLLCRKHHEELHERLERIENIIKTNVSNPLKKRIGMTCKRVGKLFIHRGKTK